MTPERWQQIKAVLAEAMDVPTGERDAFIDRASGDDTELRREVRSLLAVAQATNEGSMISHFVPSTDRVLAGATGLYEARCRVCFDPRLGASEGPKSQIPNPKSQ